MGVEQLEGVDRPGRVTGTGRYVYGVVGSSSDKEVRTRGIAGTRVEAQRFRDLAALVSTVALPIRAKRRELMSHSDVLTEVASRDTVLPVRFGTTFPSGDAVVDEFLAPRHDELVGLLAKLDGHVELVVKAYYREEAILAEIVREEPRIAKLRSRPGHAEQIELGSSVAAALQARAARDAATILDVLRPFAHDLHVDETPIEHQVVRASALVRRRDVPAVDKALDRLAGRNAGRIHFKYVGPLAPHSFVSLAPGESR